MSWHDTIKAEYSLLYYNDDDDDDDKIVVLCECFVVDKLT